MLFRSFGKQMYPLILSPFSKYNGFNFLASSGYVLLSLCQLSGLTLYVEQVMCLTPEEASFSIRLSALSLTKGITGSIRAEVAMPFLIRLPMASRRSDGRGVFGSKSLAVLSSSVVIVNETMEGIFLRRSMSLTTRVDFVIIWILQLLWDRVSRHFRVRASFFSAFG